MKILSVNTGSSSLKYQLYDMPEKKIICSGLAERIGINDSIFSIKVNGCKHLKKVDIKDHKVAVELLLKYFVEYNILKDFSEIKGIGHRIVQGGSIFNKSVIVDDQVKEDIRKLAKLAPLHNPAHLLGIESFQEAIPTAKMVVVFDTAFHQSMPKESFLYALPYEWYEKYNVRKYGFHGTSHMYVSQESAKLLNKDPKETNSIICHLGNGASLCAVKNGLSYDTTMGFTPLAGIPMGTRSGNIDPAIVSYMESVLNKNGEEITMLLNKDSGFKGLTGSSDARDIEDRIARDDKMAKLSLDIYSKKIAEFIAGFYVSLQRVDIITFTAGIGENSAVFRKHIIDRLKALGIELDTDKNNENSNEKRIISKFDSKIKVAVVPTDEEIVIAQDTFNLISEKN